MQTIIRKTHDLPTMTGIAMPQFVYHIFMVRRLDPTSSLLCFIKNFKLKLTRSVIINKYNKLTSKRKDFEYESKFYYICFFIFNIVSFVRCLWCSLCFSCKINFHKSLQKKVKIKPPLK